MNTVEIIIKKRDKKKLSEGEIRHIISGAVNGHIPDYQLSAFLMASFINGLDGDETFFMTKAMLESGRILDFSDINGIKIDKHSTGGVADTTTLILSPAVASLGVPVIKMSGRGLGFSGGTLDKLASIPGFTTDISLGIAKELVSKSNIVLMGQSENLAPADKVLYALRDVTGTVESAPLIVSSIMSKKLAAGADAIVFDVKCGSGAFMKDYASAKALAESLMSIGNKFGKKTTAVISSMNQPLGSYIGNSLEVIEAVEVLKGNVKGGLLEVSSTLGGAMLACSGAAETVNDGTAMIKEAIESGKALKKFRELIIQQHGNPEIINDYSLLPHCAVKKELKAENSGYIHSFNTDKIGMASVQTGAGRKEKDDLIDLGAGIIMKARIGDYINRGDTIAEIFSSSEEKCEASAAILKESVTLSKSQPEPDKLILDII